MEGLGVHRFWGLSPAEDLVRLHENATRGQRDSSEQPRDAQERTREHEEEADLRILCVGAGDIRHALRTVANLRRAQSESGRKRKVTIHLFDAPIECLARHLLLLAIACDWEKPLRKRANTFLEVLGNCTVQERTSKYIAEVAADLVQFVCNDRGPLRRLVDLSHLKFRETDALEQVLKSWGERTPFDVQALRDRRLRHFYDQRYDHRVGLIDGDYQNAIKPHASIVHYKQYKHWRETGVAFEFGDETYTMPNRSLASYAKGRERGESKLRRGFWTDVQVGPYFGWGVDCERTNQHAEDLFKIANKGMATEQHHHTAVHIAVFNVLSMLHSLETGGTYTLRKAGDVYSGLTRPADPKEFATSCAEGIMQLKDDVSIVLLSGDSVQSALSSRSRYKHYFDSIWLANTVAHLAADKGVLDMLRPHSTCTLAVEGVRNMVMLDNAKKKQYAQRVAAMAAQAGLNPIETSPERDPNDKGGALEVYSFTRSHQQDTLAQ